MPRNPSFFIVDPSQVKAPQIPDTGDPTVTVWCNRRGVLGALSHIVDKEYWLHILGVASFKLDFFRNAVFAVPWMGAIAEVIKEEFQSTVWPTFLQMQGYEVLHASAVIGARGVVAFCAPSETGKSTLAYGLGLRGYPVWADDAVVLDFLPHLIQTVSLPFFVRLRSSSALHYGYSETEMTAGRVLCEGNRMENALPITAICLLERAQTLPDNRVVMIDPLNAREALVRVLDHAIYFGRQDRGQKRRMMQHYLSLVGQVPVFEVCVANGLEWLPFALNEVEQRVLAG
jgi:hypothetical protein